MEEWKPVKDFDGWYEISNLGNVRSVQRIIQHKPDRFSSKGKIQVNESKVRVQSANKSGHMHVQLYRNSKPVKRYVHRLVAEAFIPNPDNKPNVNHIDGNPKNNHYSNLEWCTQKENIRHSFNTGLTPTKKRVKSISLITGNETEYESIAVAARTLGISHTGIVQQLKGRAKSCNGCKWEYA
jgi:hypothetical protein